MSPAITADVLPDLDTLSTRIFQTIFGAALLMRVTFQTIAFRSARDEDPDVDYRPRTAPAISTDEPSMRWLLQMVSFGIGALLMSYILAPGILEDPLLRVGQAYWVLQAGLLIALPVADTVRSLATGGLR